METSTPPATLEITYTFASTDHPGEVPLRWVFARSFVRPLAVCMLPIMMGATISVLQGFPALLYLTVGFPLAVFFAALWTVYRMHATVALIHVRAGMAAVQTVWDALRDRPLNWAPIYELRTAPTSFGLALGDTGYELDRTAWPDTDTLLQTLKAARSIPPFPRH